MSLKTRKLATSLSLSKQGFRTIMFLTMLVSPSQLSVSKRGFRTILVLTKLVPPIRLDSSPRSVLQRHCSQKARSSREVLATTLFLRKQDRRTKPVHFFWISFKNQCFSSGSVLRWIVASIVSLTMSSNWIGATKSARPFERTNHYGSEF